MSVQEFIFAITLSSRDAFKGLVGELTTTVLGQIGCRPPAVASLLAEVRDTIETRVREPEAFDVRFHVRSDRCEVMILQGGREIWRTSREIS